ncbi:MAG: zinc ribbon domain-containing protein [Azospira oryzae]|nr:MAG: zinc ribbon domain-containing protein [Azospira oryzae]PZP81009.1 MAG: zinc ribbon domain-containing protein [Azospira oryzae]
MPTYDYRCLACNAVFEVQQRIRAPGPVCPACGGATQKVILSAPAVHDSSAVGRELAMRSLPECGKGCRCCP